MFPLQNSAHKELTHKQLGMNRYIFSTVATDALVLTHQATSIHSADWIFIISDHFHVNILHLKFNNTWK